MTEDAKQGDRIAKVMARSGVASRRDAERMIMEGRVKVNGKPVTSPALDVLPSDKVTVDGQPIDAPQPARLWLYYKPLGLVTSEKDEKGRQTVFESLPDGMPRVMSVGRLDLNSEGLLLLTNDGELKRRLELPSTGWLRKYRVRINGRPNDLTFEPLRRGVTIEGEEFLPMEVELDRQQGANAWLTVGLREGKNREIRRAMAEVNLIVNRLIRVSYGPFRLNQMQPGDVIEVKRKILRDQLGTLFDGLAGNEETSGTRASAHAGAARKPRAEGSGERPYKPREDRDDRPRKPRAPRQDEAGGKGFRPRPEGTGDRPYRPREDKGDAPRKPRAPRPEGGEGKTFRPREDRGEAPRKSWGGKPDGGGKSFRPGEGPRKPRAEGSGDRPYRPREDKGDAPRKAWGGKPDGGKPNRQRSGDAPRKPRAEGSGDRPYRPREDRGEAPRTPRAEGSDSKSFRARTGDSRGEDRKPKPAGSDNRPRGPKGGGGKKRP